MLIYFRTSTGITISACCISFTGWFSNRRHEAKTEQKLLEMYERMQKDQAMLHEQMQEERESTTEILNALLSEKERREKDYDALLAQCKERQETLIIKLSAQLFVEVSGKALETIATGWNTLKKIATGGLLGILSRPPLSSRSVGSKDS